MRRNALSRPLRLALAHQLLTEGRSIFDYGCGRGDDLRALRVLGFDANGWDPAHNASAERRAADVVNLGYVVNVIDDPLERRRVLEAAWALARSVLVVSARLADERDEAHVAAVGDGWVTRRGTFQRFFEQDELKSWIDGALGGDAVAAGPGVFYVFRRGGEREQYLASRFRRPAALPRRRISDRLYEEHRDVLEPLIGFVADRGRLPALSELPNADDLASTFGSVRQAFRVVLNVTDQEGWDRVRSERSVDLLVHLALARFHGRARWSDLPESLQRDVSAFYNSYKAACERADKLLFATGNRDAVMLAGRAASVGKLTANAIYVHSSALNDLPALLRVYEGCARALVGTVEDATVVKLHNVEAKVSYLAYPSFDREAHPALTRSVVCDLPGLSVRTTDYSARDNPPVLHRKELFVAPSYSGHAKFARLTAQEERFGLYADPSTIGTRDGWSTACAHHGVEVRGHRVVRLPQLSVGSTP